MFNIIKKLKEKAYAEGYDAGYANGKKLADDKLLETKVHSYNQGFHDGIYSETTKALSRLATKMKGGKYVRNEFN